MMQIKNIFHTIRQSAWGRFLPVIFIIQLCFMFGLNIVSFIAVTFGAFLWLVGCLFLIIISIYLIFYNRWAILPAILLLLFPAVMYYLTIVAPPKISSSTTKFLVVYTPFLLFLAGNILLFIIARNYKSGNLNNLFNAIVFIFLTLVLLFPSYYIGTTPARLEVNSVRRQAQVIIDKVDAYYQANQRYPDSLKELGYENDDIPLTGRILPLHYVKFPDRCYFEFADPLDFLGYWHYDLKNHKWTYD